MNHEESADETYKIKYRNRQNPRFVTLGSILKPSERQRASVPKKSIFKFAIDEHIKYIEHGFLINRGRVNIKIFRTLPIKPNMIIGIGAYRLN
jgi:hypothetical protein